ncbi:MAG: WYL domain-containing protein [Bacteroidota bacterium]
MRDKKRINERDISIEDKIGVAIKKRKRITFTYDEYSNTRIFEPYLVYESTKHNYLVFGMQTYDSEKPHEGTSPKNFEIYYIKNLTVLEEDFKPDSAFNSYSFPNKIRTIYSVD